ncbi:MAG: AAA family ATPase [Lachnospiraceae bacterium]|nr:AAA family ATPase [Lachnospiraceae bacterium]
MSKTYIARVSVNYDFAQERLAELGGFFKELLEAFPGEMEAEMTIYRFTFACFILKADNLEKCRQAVYETWEKTFPGLNGISNVLISRYYTTDMLAGDDDISDEEDSANKEQKDDPGRNAGPDEDETSSNNGAGSDADNDAGNDTDSDADNDADSDAENDAENDTDSDQDQDDDEDDEPLEIIGSDLIKIIYENVYGAEEYQSLITELNETIPALKEKDAIGVLFARNYLISVDVGCGFTTLINSLGDYLHSMHVYPEDEYESRKYYTEMKMGKETANGLADPDTVMEYLDDDAEQRLYNIVGLDITYYLEGRKYVELRDFISRLEKYQSRYIFVFRIPFLEKRAHDEILNLLSDLMLISPIMIPPLNDCVLLEHIWNAVSNRRYWLNPGTFTIIFDKIHQDKMDGRFYGFKSAQKLSNELILKKIARDTERAGRGEEIDTTEIKPEDLENYVDRGKLKATGYQALEELVGMEEITARIREMIAQVKVSVNNEKLDRPCIHMRFTGAPGTGKTTVARIIGQIMREEGILRKGAFFEYSARELVAEYVGQTAVKTATICRDSYGSVLFIDEAYALYEGDQRSNDYGREAITTLISEMENHRDDMLVVMAGYTDEMDTLMKANPGLRSRMPFVLHFPNYSREQLFEIFMLMVRKHFEYTQGLEEEAGNFFKTLSDEYLESKEFANARFVRNLYERTWSKAALRNSLSGSRDMILTKEDFIAASGEKEFGEKLMTKKKLGFEG